MLRHARSFIAIRPEAFEEARSKEISETVTSGILLRSDTLANAGANALEYEGGFTSVGRASTVGSQAGIAVAAVVKLASLCADGPELLRHATRPRYAQFLISADESLFEPRKPALTARRIGRPTAPRPPVDTSKGTGGSMIPEVSWAEAPGGGGGSPGALEVDVLVAQGLGTLKDALTGATLYHGLWCVVHLLNMRALRALAKP